MKIDECAICVHFERRGPGFIECTFFGIRALRPIVVSPPSEYEVIGCPLEALSYDVSRKSW